MKVINNIVEALKKAGLKRLHAAMNQAVTHGDLSYLDSTAMNEFEMSTKRWHYIATVEQRKRDQLKPS